MKINDDVLNALKAISPTELAAKGLIEHSERGSKSENAGYCCVYCKSGRGENRTGALHFSFIDNIWQHHCSACGNGGDNIKLFEAIFDSQFRDACLKACEIFNINCEDYNTILEKNSSKMPASQNANTDLQKVYNSADARKELEFIKADIENAQKYLHELPESQRRCLTLETYKHFNAGFLPKWTSPKNRVEGKKLYPSRRIIIPTDTLTGYDAILLDADRNDNNRDFHKIRAGKKTIFNQKAILADSDFIAIVEGAIDAITICQVTDGQIPALATLGAGNHNALVKLLDSQNITNKIILILFDADETGRDNSRRLHNQLINKNIPCANKTFYDFLTDADKLDLGIKIDANDLLVKRGSDFLNNILNKIISQARADFDAKAQINFSSLNAEQKEFLFAGDSSDLDNARRITYFTGDIIKYSITSSEWFYFEKCNDSGVWKNHGQETAVIKNHALTLADLMLAAAKGDKNETELAKTFKKNRNINSAIDIIKALDGIFISEKDLDNHPTLVNCLNGVVDLETGKLYPAKPELLLTQQAGGNFKGVDFHYPLVDKFLTDVLPDPDTLQALLCYLGYSLTGLVRDHKALFVFGPGRNGKGTLTRLQLATFGDYATELPKSAVLKAERSKEAGAPSPELMVLKKKRLAIVEEISDPDYRLDSTKIKNLAGGDRVSARALHKNYESGGGFDPTHKLLLSGNKLPRLDDVRDIGLIERLLNVPFEQKFLKPDTSLSEKLAAQDAIDAMFSILVKNAGEYLRSGLLESQKTTEAKQNYLDTNDWLNEFFDEYCVFVPSAETKRKALIELLREKCIKQTAPYNKTELVEMILNATKQHGVQLKLDRTKQLHFYGIGIKDDANT